MKKTIILLALLTAILLPSCADFSTDDVEIDLSNVLTVGIPSYTESEDKPLNTFGRLLGMRYQYYNDCLYFYEGQGLGTYNLSSYFEASTLLRMNVKTGTLTTVCPDPLCMHNSPECPFAGMIHNLSIEGDKIIYTRQYADRDNEIEWKTNYYQICSYDLTNMEMTVHLEKKELPGEPFALKKSMLYHNGYIYYYDHIYNDENKSFDQAICRINTKNNQNDVIVNQNTVNPINFLFVLNNRIYFTDIDTIYSVNLDIEDKQIHAKGKFSTDRIYTDGQYIYYAQTTPDYLDNLFRMNLDGSNIIDLEITTDPSWLLTEKYIYYFPHDHLNYYYPNGQLAFISACNTVWRCDHDGSNKTMVAEFERSERGFIQPYYVQVIGNYIYTDYYEYVDKNESGFFESDQDRYAYSSTDSQGPHILRIDLTTGEMIKLNIPDV